MFAFAFLTGIYSYIIFFLGIFGQLYRNYVLVSSVIYVLLVLILFKNYPKVLAIKLYKKTSIVKEALKNRLSLVLIILLTVQILINFIGVLGPEVSFDALWYHLTLPKLYILNHSIFHISGGLLYYSDMPKLVEMLYVPFLMFGNEIGAKFLHFVFGILVLFILYIISIRFLSKNLSLLVLILFYSNLVVGWESITAYVDLARTFFELLSFYGFIIWFKNRNSKYLFYSAIILGFAITVKLVVIFDLLIFLCLFVYLKKDIFKNIIQFSGISLLIPLPWFIFSYLNTGNLFYPYFSLPVDSGHFLNMPTLSSLINFSDPISPIYLILLPIILLSYKQFDKNTKLIFIMFITGILIWFLTQTGRGTRFLLPYLPLASILCILIIQSFKSIIIKKYLYVLIIIISLTSIGYRLIANIKFLPVVIGKESREYFLTNHLNFSFGDFYDVDGYFKNNIQKSDKVLLYGFHNLYYVNFPYIDSSWVKKGDKFNYIAVQNANIPDRFLDWKKVYYNNQTRVGLYSKEAIIWEY